MCEFMYSNINSYARIHNFMGCSPARLVEVVHGAVKGMLRAGADCSVLGLASLNGG